MIAKMMPNFGAIAFMSGMLLAGTSMAAPPPPAAFTSQVTAASTHVKPGENAALSISLADRTLNARNAVMDLEVYNAKNVRVAQKFWQGQNFAKGKSSVYHWSWKPTAPGAYTIKIGIFGSGWKPLYHWRDKALALTVS